MALRPFWSGLSIALASAVAVSCAQLPTFGVTQSPAAAADPAETPSSLVAFLADARPGDSTFIPDPDTGERVSVTAEKIYFAASGQFCRRYAFTNAKSGAPMSSGLACKNGDNEWRLHKLLSNPNSVIPF